MSDDLNNIHIIGINHWTAPVETREQFNLSNDQVKSLILSAQELKIKAIVPLSTCNRVEIYTITHDPTEIIELFCRQTNTTTHLFHTYGFIKSGKAAIDHIFKVTAGIDSRILGDFQVAGQVKVALQQALDENSTDAVLSKMIHQALATSKIIKAKTKISAGASSVASAAVAYLKQQDAGLRNKKILLFGTGKMGKLTVKNLLKLTNPDQITMINRSEEKAETLAKQLNINAGKINELERTIAESDIIIVATASNNYTVSSQEFDTNKYHNNKIFIDLSLPRNIDPQLAAFDFVQIINLDDLEDIQSQALFERQQSIPLALEIINEGQGKFFDWMDRYSFVNSIKSELEDTIFENGLGLESNIDSKFLGKITGDFISNWQRYRKAG